MTIKERHPILGINNYSEISEDFRTQVEEIFTAESKLPQYDLKDKIRGYIRLKVEDELEENEAKILQAFEEVLDWQTTYHLEADLEFEVMNHYVDYRSEELDLDDIRAVLNGEKELEEVIDDDLHSHVESNYDNGIDVCYSERAENVELRIEIQNLRLKPDQYGEFKEAVFQCLKREDDDCKGYDALVENITSGDPSQVSRWIERVMIDWRAR